MRAISFSRPISFSILFSDARLFKFIRYSFVSVFGASSAPSTSSLLFNDEVSSLEEFDP